MIKEIKFNINIVDFPFLNGDFLRGASYWVNTSQIVPLPKASNSFKTNQLTRSLHNRKTVETGVRYNKQIKKVS